MESPIRYSLPEDLSFSDLLDQTARTFRLRKLPSQNLRLNCLDTFDWRLFCGNAVLYQSPSSFILRRVDPEKTLLEWPLPSSGTPRFARDFEDARIRTILEKYTGPRALIPYLSLRSRIDGYAVLNADEKTVLQIFLETIRHARDGEPHRSFRALRLQPVRGYHRDLARFRDFLASLNLVEDSTPLIVQIAGAQGIRIGENCHKFYNTVAPEMTGRQAALIILSGLFEIVQSNEKGVIEDIDTEFLHYFRIAIRKSRSFLSQMKDIFPPEITEKLRGDLSHLGRLSNPQRDLDVYLLKEKIYCDILPPALWSGLDPLFRQLRRERGKAHRRLVKALRSASCRHMLRNWKNFLDPTQADEYEETPNSGKPILSLAQRNIAKSYRQIKNTGRRIDERASDAQFHRLRIECKILRYLLEFFQALFPAGDIQHLIGDLKRVQDNLGEYNDLAVQQNYLSAFLRAMPAEKEETIALAAAIGGLVCHLHDRQNSVRENFAREFRKFMSPENTALFRHLFEKNRRKESSN